MSQLKGYAGLRARLEALGGTNPQLMNRIGLAGVREAKLLVRRKTGHLGRNIRVQSFSARNVVVEAATGYAGFVEYGTKPHVITPNARKALRFAASASGRRLTGTPRTGAAVIFAKRVNHPGSKAHPFLVPGMRKAAEGIGGDIVKAWDESA